MRIPSGVTNKYIYFVAVDATDLKTRETGLSSFTVYRSRNGGAATAYTTPTINETSSANMPGVYELLLDEDMTIDSGDDTQEVCIHITHAGMAPVTRTFELYRPKITVGETITVSSSAVSAVTTVSTVSGNVGGNVTGSVGSVVGAVGSVTGNVGGNVTGSVGSIASGGITAASIASDAITAAKVAADVGTEIGTAVWATTTRQLTGTQTFNVTGNITGNLSGSVGSVTGAVGSVTGNVGGNVVGSVGSVTGAVGSVTGNVGGIAGTITTLDALDTAQDAQHLATQTGISNLNNLSAAQVNAEVDTALADIHLDHLLAVDYDPASKPGTATALLNELVENDGGVSRFTANALEQGPGGGSAPTASQVADAVWDEARSGHTTAGTFGFYLDAAVSGVGGAVGSGAIATTVTVNDGTDPIAGVDVWISTDSAGSNIVAGVLVTNAFGVAVFQLDAGTYYVWKQKAGYNFTNPESMVVS